MEAGTYAWIVVSIFFIVFTAIQIRNCMKNVECRGSSYDDMYPNFMPPAQLGAPIFTIAGSRVNGADTTTSATPATPAYINTGYQVTETHANKTDLNDGLPTYEEVIARNASPTQHEYSGVTSTISNSISQTTSTATTTTTTT